MKMDGSRNLQNIFPGMVRRTVIKPKFGIQSAKPQNATNQAQNLVTNVVQQYYRPGHARRQSINNPKGISPNERSVYEKFLSTVSDPTYSPKDKNEKRLYENFLSSVSSKHHVQDVNVMRNNKQGHSTKTSIMSKNERRRYNMPSPPRDLNVQSKRKGKKNSDYESESDVGVHSQFSSGKRKKKKKVESRSIKYQDFSGSEESSSSYPKLKLKRRRLPSAKHQVVDAEDYDEQLSEEDMIASMIQKKGKKVKKKKSKLRVKEGINQKLKKRNLMYQGRNSRHTEDDYLMMRRKPKKQRRRGVPPKKLEEAEDRPISYRFDISTEQQHSFEESQSDSGQKAYFRVVSESSASSSSGSESEEEEVETIPITYHCDLYTGGADTGLSQVGNQSVGNGTAKKPRPKSFVTQFSEENIFPSTSGLDSESETHSHPAGGVNQDANPLGTASEEPDGKLVFQEYLQFGLNMGSAVSKQSHLSNETSQQLPPSIESIISASRGEGSQAVSAPLPLEKTRDSSTSSAMETKASAANEKSAAAGMSNFFPPEDTVASRSWTAGKSMPAPLIPNPELKKEKVALDLAAPVIVDRRKQKQDSQKKGAGEETVKTEPGSEEIHKDGLPEEGAAKDPFAQLRVMKEKMSRLRKLQEEKQLEAEKRLSVLDGQEDHLNQLHHVYQQEWNEQQLLMSSMTIPSPALLQAIQKKQLEIGVQMEGLQGDWHKLLERRQVLKQELLLQSEALKTTEAHLQKEIQDEQQRIVSSGISLDSEPSPPRVKEETHSNLKDKVSDESTESKDPGVDGDGKYQKSKEESLQPETDHVASKSRSKSKTQQADQLSSRSSARSKRKEKVQNKKRDKTLEKMQTLQSMYTSLCTEEENQYGDTINDRVVHASDDENGSRDRPFSEEKQRSRDARKSRSLSNERGGSEDWGPRRRTGISEWDKEDEGFPDNGNRTGDGPDGDESPPWQEPGYYSSEKPERRTGSSPPRGKKGKSDRRGRSSTPKSRSIDEMEKWPRGEALPQNPRGQLFGMSPERRPRSRSRGFDPARRPLRSWSRERPMEGNSPAPRSIDEMQKWPRGEALPGDHDNMKRRPHRRGSMEEGAFRRSRSRGRSFEGDRLFQRGRKPSRYSDDDPRPMGREPRWPRGRSRSPISDRDRWAAGENPPSQPESKVEKAFQEWKRGRKDAPPAPKISVCQFFANGKCSWGDRCPHVHTLDFDKRDHVCIFWIRGRCLYGDDCLFSHDLNHPDAVCQDFMNTGSCRFGADCMFRHGKSAPPEEFEMPPAAKPLDDEEFLRRECERMTVKVKAKKMKKKANEDDEKANEDDQKANEDDGKDKKGKDDEHKRDDDNIPSSEKSNENILNLTFGPDDTLDDLETDTKGAQDSKGGTFDSFLSNLGVSEASRSGKESQKAKAQKEAATKDLAKILATSDLKATGEPGIELFWRKFITTFNAEVNESTKIKCKYISRKGEEKADFELPLVAELQEILQLPPTVALQVKGYPTKQIAYNQACFSFCQLLFPNCKTPSNLHKALNQLIKKRGTKKKA